MSTTEVRPENAFHANELVTWHYRDGRQTTPIPAVVIRQEPQCVVIRARIQGMVKELQVSPDELVER